MKQAILEIQWDSNCFKDQRPVYHVQMRVKKIKTYRNTTVRWLLSLRRSMKTILGTITHCSIELTQQELSLLMPLSQQNDIKTGDLLDLLISEKGWCIEVIKHDPN